MSRLVKQALLVLVALIALGLIARAFAADIRLDIVQVDAAGNPVSITSQTIVTFNYATPVLTAYARQDGVFGNGFDS